MPTALILGAYGLIGSACARALSQDGFSIIGLGRSRRAAQGTPGINRWVFRDLTTMSDADWMEALEGVDVVVNAAGALQNGPRDHLEAIHAQMPARFSRLLQPSHRLIQISAAGVSPEASTEFFRSKARGDAAVMRKAPNWVILRPTLVMSPDAYGGTGLLRGAAALPGMLPEVLPQAQVQTVHVEDLAKAVVTAARGRVPSGTIADITAGDVHSLPDLIGKLRTWQGLPPARLKLKIPDLLISLTGRAADAAGHLGWRSPLRSTALAALRDGVRGDPSSWTAAGGSPCRTLDETLVSLPATRQERLYGRFYFALPAAIVTLSVFWLLSGLITLMDPGAAAAYLASSPLPHWLVTATVIGGALADIALGAAILWRPWCRAAALGMAGLATLYLIGGALAAPWLWADPLGPMVKVLPGMVLALSVWLRVEQR